MQKWYTISRAANYLGVSPDTLRRWERAKKIPAPARTTGGARRYSKELLDQILTRGEQEKVQPTSSSSKNTFLIGIISTLVTLAILLPILFLLF